MPEPIGDGDGIRFLIPAPPRIIVMPTVVKRPCGLKG